MKKLFAAFGLLLVLTACAEDQAPPPAHVSHTLPPKISLDVQTISLADRSGLQPASSPYNGNRFSPTISEAIKQWAGDRLQAAGQTGQAIIVVKDASLIAQPMPVKEGIDGWFTRQQGTKYIARAEVSIEATGRPGFALADAVATRAITLPENPSPIEKQDAYYTLLNGLMKDLGQNLETGIQTHMGNFIVTPQVYGVTAVPTGSSVYAGEATNGESPVIIQSPVASSMGGMQMGMQPPALPLSGVQVADSQLSNAPSSGSYGAQQGMNSAVASATVPMPPQVPVSPPTSTISQYGSQQPYGQQQQYAPQSYAQPQYNQQQCDPATQYNAPYNTQGNRTASVSTVTQAPLPPAPMQQTQQMLPPIYGTAAVPTVPDLGSAPSSFAQQPQQQAYTQQQPNGSYNNSNGYAGAPQQQAAPPAYNSYASQQQPQQQQNNGYASYNAPPQQPGPSTFTYPDAAQPLPQPAYNNTNSYSYAAAAPMAQQAPRGAPATIPLSGPSYYAQ